MLNPDEINHFKQRLEHERAEALSRIAGRNRELDGMGPRADDIVDEADEAKAVSDQEPEAAGNQLDQETIGRIERALQRIEEGTYGVSEVSGKPIPKERLEAVPYATTLVDEQPPPE